MTTHILSEFWKLVFPYCERICGVAVKREVLRVEMIVVAVMVVEILVVEILYARMFISPDMFSRDHEPSEILYIVQPFGCEAQNLDSLVLIVNEAPLIQET